MAIQVGGSTPDKFYIGSSAVDRLYQGSNLVWELSGGPPTDTAILGFDERITTNTLSCKGGAMALTQTVDCISIGYRAESGSRTNGETITALLVEINGNSTLKTILWQGTQVVSDTVSEWMDFTVPSITLNHTLDAFGALFHASSGTMKTFVGDGAGFSQLPAYASYYKGYRYDGIPAETAVMGTLNYDSYTVRFEVVP